VSKQDATTSQTEATVTWSGHCLCQTVAFTIEGTIISFYSCFCGRCQKATGASNAVNAFVDNGVLIWHSGLEQVREFELSFDTNFNKAFCGICGSALPCQAKSGDFLIVPIGCVDTTIAVPIERSIYWSSRPAWYDTFQDAPRCERD
jgi:hypothetical protein